MPPGITFKRSTVFLRLHVYFFTQFSISIGYLFVLCCRGSFAHIFIRVLLRGVLFCSCVCYSFYWVFVSPVSLRPPENRLAEKDRLELRHLDISVFGVL